MFPGVRNEPTCTSNVEIKAYNTHLASSLDFQVLNVLYLILFEHVVDFFDVDEVFQLEILLSQRECPVSVRIQRHDGGIISVRKLLPNQPGEQGKEDIRVSAY